MKTILYLMLLVAIAAILSGCTYVTDSSFVSHGDYRAVTNLTQTGELPAELKSLSVDNRFGALRVVGGEAGPGNWIWKLTVRARTEAEAQQAADAARCNLERDGHGWRLLVSLPRLDGRASFQSDLTVQVPQAASLRTRNEFGQTEVANVNGEVESNGRNGSVEVRNAGSKVVAETSFAELKIRDCGPARLANQNGKIEATGIRGALEAETSFAQLVARDIAGPVRLRNRNGAVELTGAGGNADIKTSFAELSAKGVKGDATLENQNGEITTTDVSGSVEARTSFGAIDVQAAGPKFTCLNHNGSIRLRAASTTLASIEAKTSFSPIEVRLPGSLKPAIQARTSFADIESDFPVLMKPRGTDPFVDVAPGTPRVTVENQNGPIRIARD